MKKTILIIAIAFITNGLLAQKYFTKTGHVSFFSATPVENIEAHNYQTTSVIDFSTGEIVFSVLMKSFEFEKALMQEHFNEKYVESDTYPKSTFKGKITDFEKVNLKKDGVYEVNITGEMLIHGTTNKVNAKGKLEVKNGTIIGTSTFQLEPETYKVTIPSLVRDKIAKSLTIKVKMEYKPYEK